MTTVQRVAQVFGIGFLLAAVAGFVAAGASMDPHTATAPRALGLPLAYFGFAARGDVPAGTRV